MATPPGSGPDTQSPVSVCHETHVELWQRASWHPSRGPRAGAGPRGDGNRIERNGQYGLALFDCAGSVGDNAIAANGRGAVSGECDADDAPMS